MDSVICEPKKGARQFTKWLGSNAKFTRLYRSSIDGTAAGTFHNKCNDKGPTLTLVKLQTNRIFGGYTSISWSSSGAYVNDNASWLFRLEPNPIKIEHKKDNQSSVYHNSGYFSTFGSNHDLFIANGFASSSSNVGGSFICPPSENPTTVLAGAQNGWQIQEFEVFVVERTNIIPLLIPDWANDVKELKKWISSYSPSNGKALGVNTVNISLFGGAGTGKSTCINGVQSAFKGRAVNRALAGGNGDHITTGYNDYFLDSNLAICLWDSMGFSLKNYSGAAFEFMLDGLLLPNFDFQQEPVFGKQGTRANPKLDDKIHSICLFVPAMQVSDSGHCARVVEFVNRARSRNLQVLLVLSQVDEYVDELQSPEDYQDVYCNPTVIELVDTVAKNTGLSRMNVVPLINYHSIPPPNTYLDYIVLNLLQRALYNADDYFDALHQANLRKAKKANPTSG